MPRISRLWLLMLFAVVTFAVILLGVHWPVTESFKLALPHPGLAGATPTKPEPLSFLGPSEYRGKTVGQVKLPTQEKVIALTLDDGPWGKSTEEVLAILAKQNVKATFFWIGLHLKSYPEVARKVVQAGHAVANHSWSHPYKLVSPDLAKPEIENTSYLIAKTTQVQTRLFRPPGGILDNGLVAYAQQKNYTTVMWSIDPHDSAPKVTAAEIVQRVVSQAKSGRIILLHDGGGDRRATIKALPTIIAKLKAQGYRFVTVPELLNLAVGRPTPGPTPTPMIRPSPSPTPLDSPTPAASPIPSPLPVPTASPSIAPAPPSSGELLEPPPPVNRIEPIP